jgi:glycosidase
MDAGRAKAVRHHSRLREYRDPPGARGSGSLVRLCVRAGPAYENANVLLALRTGEDERLVLMDRAQDGGETVFSFGLRLPDTTGLVHYYFIVNDGRSLSYLGNNPSLTGGEGQVYDRVPPPFTITVFDPVFRTPDWFKRAVVYQIFPDRFCAGNRESFLRGVRAHREAGREIAVHEDWDEPPEYRPRCGEYVPNDFYGGDLYGVAQKLPYLRSLGVTAIYLNPIFESPSNHRYDTGDYHTVDPMLGGNEAFAHLAEAARAQGVRIILDGVFSHTGSDSVYFNKYGRYKSVGAAQSDASPYYKWYNFTEFPLRYASWWGFETLPETKEQYPGYLDFMLRDDDAVVKRWLRAGASGWRLDVADELPDAFIRLLRSEAKAADPDAVIIGEVWEDAATKVSMGSRRAYVDGHELDSVTNYPLRALLLGFLTGSLDAYALQAGMMSLWENYPREFFYALLNLVSSHDVERALTVLSGAPPAASLTREQQAAYTPDEESLRTARARMKALVFLQTALPGVPCVYYGDEAGMQGMRDPFNRGTYPWGREDGGLLAFFRRTIARRNASPALREGEFSAAALCADVIAVFRQYGAGGEREGCVALVNRGATPQTVTLDFHAPLEGEADFTRMGDAVRFEDAEKGKYYLCRNRRVTVTLEPLGRALLTGGASGGAQAECINTNQTGRRTEYGKDYQGYAGWRGAGNGRIGRAPVSGDGHALPGLPGRADGKPGNGLQGT